jgi:hypothetical protein
LTSTEDTAYRLPKITTYSDLVELELRKLEDVNSATTLPAAYVIARGFAAVAYAVLALRETCEDQGTDVSNALADLASAAGDTAVSVADLADAATAARWWTRLAWRVQFALRVRGLRLDQGPQEP